MRKISVRVSNQNKLFRKSCLYKFKFEIRMKVLTIVALLFAVAVVSSERMRFDHHKVYKLDVRNDEQMDVLRQLEETFNGEYTFFDSARVGQSVDVVVPPQKLYEFGGILKSFNIDHELKTENLQR